MILEPPLWATDAWVDETWADGTWATEVVEQALVGNVPDLTASFAPNLELRATFAPNISLTGSIEG